MSLSPHAAEPEGDYVTCPHGIAHDPRESDAENCEQCDKHEAISCTRCGVARFEHTDSNYWACFEFTEAEQPATLAERQESAATEYEGEYRVSAELVGEWLIEVVEAAA